MPESFWLATATALLGGVGAVCRFVLDVTVMSRVVRSVRGSRLPWGTLVVNVGGSFAIGIVAGLAVRGALPEAWAWALGIGFLGGFTTLSTASFETVTLLQRGRWKAALVTGFGQLLAATLAAALGWWIAAFVFLGV